MRVDVRDTLNEHERGADGAAQVAAETEPLMPWARDAVPLGGESETVDPARERRIELVVNGRRSPGRRWPRRWVSIGAIAVLLAAAGVATMGGGEKAPSHQELGQAHLTGPSHVPAGHLAGPARATLWMRARARQQKHDLAASRKRQARAKARRHRKEASRRAAHARQQRRRRRREGTEDREKGSSATASVAPTYGVPATAPVETESPEYVESEPTYEPPPSEAPSENAPPAEESPPPTESAAPPSEAAAEPSEASPPTETSPTEEFRGGFDER